MFVPYEPDLCFDVERHTDRCVCGCSALKTSRTGINTGYCNECAEKRKEFVEGIVGNIYLEEKNTVYIMLNIIENLRKSFLQERIYYMVDRYFGIHQFENFQEPYENDSFVAQVYREKHNLMETFMSNIPSSLQSKRIFDNNKVYDCYLYELNKMLQEDDDKLNEITARLGGYTYSKKK